MRMTREMKAKDLFMVIAGTGNRWLKVRETDMELTIWPEDADDMAALFTNLAREMRAEGGKA